MANGITAEIKKINILLDQKLSIPPYQRPYRWKEENVRLLLQDIYDSWKSGKKSYRIGSVILYKKVENDPNSQIVDGQQRITTILLILHMLNCEVGKEQLVSLKYEHLESKNNIVQNYNYAKNWINSKIGNDNVDFSKYLTDYCEFVEIVVTDLSEAFQMFDSQNGRGKELETYNLLKAYHIRAMDSETQETKIECDRRWENATRYKIKQNDESEHSSDILKRIFNEQLFRTRIWSRREVAYGFNKQKLSEFKGISIDKNSAIQYPFQNIQLMQYIANNYFESIGLGIKGIKSRFQKEITNVNPFVLINQDIVNGKSFFDYIETYVEIYKQLFRIADKNNQLTKFNSFYKSQYCEYYGSKRSGDTYLRELYKSLIFLVFDKYGEEGVNDYFETLYAVVYRVRLENKQVKYASVANYAHSEKLFSTIENSKGYHEMQIIEKKAKEKIICKKNVDGIVNFFRKKGVEINIV